MLHEKGIPSSIHTIRVKQDELAKELGVSRQALNLHLRRLRDADYIRTGRGFIDITEEGLGALGIFSNPAFVLVRASPTRRISVYDKVKELAVQRAFRIAGDFDAIVIVDRQKLDDVLKKLYSIEGIQDTRSYVTIEPIK